MKRPFKLWGTAIMLLGMVSLVIGGVFIAEAVVKDRELYTALKEEKVNYNAEGANLGLIDTPDKAVQMAAVLKGHRFEQGIYTELPRNDPKRATILDAMTLENSLHIAHLGHGVVQVVTAAGVGLIIIGLALGGTGLAMRKISVAA